MDEQPTKGRGRGWLRLGDGARPATRIPPNLSVGLGLLAATMVGRRFGESDAPLWLEGLLSPTGLAAVWILGLILLGGRRRVGWVVLVLLMQWARGAPDPPLDLARLHGEGVPTTVRVDSCSHWDPGPFSLRATCRVRTMGRGVGVRPVSRSVRISLPLELEEPPTCARVRGRLRVGASPRNRMDGDAAEGPAVWTLSVKSERLVESESCGAWLDLWSRGTLAMRRVWRRAGESSPGSEPWSGRSWALAAAMWTGDRDLVDREVEAGFANWGLVHLLAASGLHVGIVLGIGAVGLSLLTVPGTRGPAVARWLGWIWMAGGSVLLLLSVGPRPSIVRALCMALGVGVSIWSRRPSHGLGHLGLALGVVGLFRPDPGRDLGAILSFCATAAVVVLTPRFVRAWTLLPRGLAWTLAATVSAQLATAPWSHRIDPMIPLGAPLANLVAAPMAAWTLVYGGVAWAFSALGYGLPSPVHRGFGIPIEAWLTTVTGPPLPWLQPLWPGGAAGLAVWCAGVCGALLAPRRAGWLLLPLVAALFVPGPRITSVSFLDVGQGDATLMRSEGLAVLVDGGGWQGGHVERSVLLPVLARAGIQRLEAVVLTHGDADHCLGLRDLARRFPIGELWLGRTGTLDSAGDPGSCESALLERFRGRVRRLHRGQRLRLGRWVIEVLLDGAEGASDNDRSVVLTSRSEALEVLLTGDIERAAEARLAARLGGAASHLPRRHRVLKVAHHGSRTSTSEELLDAFRPDLAVISVGRRNVYGHPAELVLDRLDAHGVEILRTDREGRIEWLQVGATDGPLCFNTAARSGRVRVSRRRGEDVERQSGVLVDSATASDPCDPGRDGDR